MSREPPWVPDRAIGGTLQNSRAGALDRRVGGGSARAGRVQRPGHPGRSARAGPQATSVPTSGVMGPSSTRVRVRHGRPMDDATRVLVGYATAAGSTTGIAERIAAILHDAGGDVTCRPVGHDLDPAA